MSDYEGIWRGIVEFIICDPDTTTTPNGLLVNNDPDVGYLAPLIDTLIESGDEFLANRLQNLVRKGSLTFNYSPKNCMLYLSVGYTFNFVTLPTPLAVA